MAQMSLLIDYEYCTGCHTCEVACRNAKQIPRGKWGIKLTQVGPFKLGDDKWEWTYIPVPTDLCDLCGDLTSEGKKPACVHHCMALCMEFGTVEEMASKMTEKGKKVSMFIP
jgi:Fe-S-cluster-containing dehydrogenase component